MKRYFLTCVSIFLFIMIGHAQKTISGIVNDSDGLPLPGASVVEKGTNNGVTSDFDGNYSITVQPGTYTLVFSFVGYRTKELTNIKVGQNDIKEINVNLLYPMIFNTNL